MQALLKKQTDLLSSLDKNAKLDNVIQIAQLNQTNQIDDDGDRLETEIKDLNKNVKSLNEKTGDGLNSNVIKLFKEIEKVGKVVTSRPMNSEEAAKITEQVGERRQFNTIKPRAENFKEGFKDFFTMRGFLDKTGIASRGSGGLVSEYLDRGEAKKNYVDKRTQLATDMAKVDPSVRPKGFDTRTGEIKVKPENATEQQAKVSADVIPFPGGAAAGGGGEEAMLEQNRMVAEQTGLLSKIEENTRALQGAGGAVAAGATTAAGGLGAMDLLGGAGRLGGIAKTAGRGLMAGAKTAGSFLLKRAGPVAALAAVGAGAYQGITGYQSASDKEKAALEGIDAKVASGEITEEQAKNLRVESKETATVDKSKAVGGGAGTAAGGVAGALKGAAVGAAIGSAIPIVGTVIGGAIGAGLGAVGGSYLGNKGGEYLGEKFGKAKNFLFGKSGESERATTGSSVSIDFSEAQFSQSDPENYAKFVKDRDELTQKYATESAKKFNRKPSQEDFQVAKAKAEVETIQKYKKEIEAAGAGKVTGGIKEKPTAPGDKTTEALKKTAEGVTGVEGKRVNGKVVGPIKFNGKTVKPGDAEYENASAALNKELDGDKPDVTPNTPEEVAAYTKQQKDKAARGEIQLQIGTFDGESAESAVMNSMLTAEKRRKARSQPSKATPDPVSAITPATGNVISKQSGDNEQAKMDSNKGGGNTSIVAAPTVNNNNTVQNNQTKLPPRNTDSTINKYMQSRWAY